MTCDDLDMALCSGEPEQIAAARRHAAGCAACREQLAFWDELSAAARTLHREWESRSLWPRIVTGMGAAGMEADGGPAASRPRTVAASGLRWWSWTPAMRLAAACALTVAIVAPLTWYAARGLGGPAAPGSTRQTSIDRLLDERALSQVERAEADYIRAIDALSARATPRLAEPDSPLVMNLRERLIAIDAAIDDCRAAIERNRFNAHLRRELLSIYREKQRTLEQILEPAKDVS